MATEMDMINSCASLIHKSTDPSRIMDILERLQSVEMTIVTLKATRIGVIINKLAGDSKMPSNVRNFAFSIVNEWKEIANAAVQHQNNRSPSPIPIPQTTTTTTSQSQRSRKRSVSQMERSDLHHQSSNSHHYESNKRRRMARGRDNSALSAMTAGIRSNKVPKLQSICIKQMAKNPIAIGRIPCELDSSLCLQIYGSLKPSELKKVYKMNPHLRKHLDPLWKQQVMALCPTYEKRDKSMSWFKAYQIYLLDRRDKLESAKMKLQAQREEAKQMKQSSCRLLSKEEARVFKSQVKRSHRERKRYNGYCSRTNNPKGRSMMGECRDFVNRRNRMFKLSAIQNNAKVRAQHERKQSFVRRQKEMRRRREEEKTRMYH